jgi:non-homologous end joining protein Ku
LAEVAPSKRAPSKVIDLMSVLQESLQQAQKWGEKESEACGAA